MGKEYKTVWREARLSAFRPGELRMSGHIQTKCNFCGWW